MSSPIATRPTPSEPQNHVKISPLAGQPAPKEMLVDLARLEREYFERQPDLGDPNQMVSFGTSGHRGSPLHGTFTEAHILSITQAICEYRRQSGTDGPLFMGKDTHAVSDPAQRTALEVLAANNVDTWIQRDNGITPTPVISHAILVYNRGRADHQSDGIVITPSHNPPADGGFIFGQRPPQHWRRLRHAEIAHRGDVNRRALGARDPGQVAVVDDPAMTPALQVGMHRDLTPGMQHPHRTAAHRHLHPLADQPPWH